MGKNHQCRFYSTVLINNGLIFPSTFNFFVNLNRMGVDCIFNILNQYIEPSWRTEEFQHPDGHSGTTTVFTWLDSLIPEAKRFCKQERATFWPWIPLSCQAISPANSARPTFPHPGMLCERQRPGKEKESVCKLGGMSLQQQQPPWYRIWQLCRASAIFSKLFHKCGCQDCLSWQTIRLWHQNIRYMRFCFAWVGWGGGSIFCILHKHINSHEQVNLPLPLSLFYNTCICFC